MSHVETSQTPQKQEPEKEPQQTKSASEDKPEKPPAIVDYASI